MKRLLFFITLGLWVLSASAQCYEPNLRKADAEYAKGNYQSAYNYYQRATKCPDASRFENGEKAKAGMKKCYASLKVDGKKEVSITVGQKAGRRTFTVSSARLNKDSWRAYTYSKGCKITEQNHRDNTITIEWEEYKMVGTRTFTVTLYGDGVNYVNAVINITQQGYPDEIVIKQPDEKYDTIIKGSSGISFVLLRGKYGFVDSTGRAITPLKYTFTTEKTIYKDGDIETHWGEKVMLMRVFAKDKYGFIDCKGKEIVPLQYDYISTSYLNYSISSTIVKRNNKFGLLDGNGKEVVPCIYERGKGGSYRLDDIEPVAFRRNGLWALFNREGKQLTDFKYDSICNFGYSIINGYPVLCQVIIDGKHGFVDYDGKEVIKPQYDNALSFHNNRAFVEKNKKCGFINQFGKIVIPLKYRYDGWCGFNDGISWVLDEDGYKQIDTMGNVISANTYSEIKRHSWPEHRYQGCYETYRKGNIFIVGYYGRQYTTEEGYLNDIEGLREAAEKNVDGEQIVLYRRYIKLGDTVNSFKWNLRAAEAANPTAWNDLAKKYYHGYGVERNHNNAYKWFVKASTAYNGEAMAYLGWMLWNGQGCPVDKQASRKMFYNALRAGYDDAFDWMKQLGMDTTELKPY